MLRRRAGSSRGLSGCDSPSYGHVAALQVGLTRQSGPSIVHVTVQAAGSAAHAFCSLRGTIAQGDLVSYSFHHLMRQHGILAGATHDSSYNRFCCHQVMHILVDCSLQTGQLHLQVPDRNLWHIRTFIV